MAAVCHSLCQQLAFGPSTLYLQIIFTRMGNLDAPPLCTAFQAIKQQNRQTPLFILIPLFIVQFEVTLPRRRRRLCCRASLIGAQNYSLGQIAWHSYQTLALVRLVHTVGCDVQDLLLEAMFHNNLDFARFAHDIVGDEMTQLAAMRHPVSENSGHYEFIEGNLHEASDLRLGTRCCTWGVNLVSQICLYCTLQSLDFLPLCGWSLNSKESSTCAFGQFSSSTLTRACRRRRVNKKSTTTHTAKISLRHGLTLKWGGEGAVI